MVILVLFVFIDYLSRMERFLKSDISMMGALNYVLLKLPFMFVQLTPAGILLASITVFGLMNRNNELLAIRSSGISTYCLFKPAIAAACGFALLMFFLGETVIPVFMAKVHYIEYNVFGKRPEMKIGQENIWIRSDNRMIHIHYYDPGRQSMSGVTVTTLNENFDLISRIDAPSGFFMDGAWVLEKAIEQIHDPDTRQYEVITHDRKTVALAVQPDDLGAVAKKSDEMGFSELREYVRKVASEGYDATVYRVDLNAKIAFPFICVIMVLTGAATGMRPFARNNLPSAIALGVVISFIYWISYGFSLSLGYGAVLPPLISAWITNLFFVCLGILYLVYTE